MRIRKRDPAAIRGRLDTRRQVTGVYRDHKLTTTEDEVDHEIRAGQTQVRRLAARTDQQTQLASAKDQAKLAAMFSRATVQGSGARLKAQMESSGEIRALKVSSAGRWSLHLGIPILLAFGAWSTTGVHEGVVILLGLDTWSATWWAAWLVEPAIICTVAGLLIFSAILRRNGGTVDWRIKIAEFGGLATSVLLNAVGPIAVAIGFWPGLGALIPHSLGPLGAAITAWLLGVCDEHVSRARPWDGAPSVMDMDLRMPDLTRITNPFQVDTRPAVRARAVRDDDQGDAVPAGGLVEGPPVAKVAGPPPPTAAVEAAPDWDTPIDLVPVTPAAPAGVPDLLAEAMVPDEIPSDWVADYYRSAPAIDPPPQGGGVGTIEPIRPTHTQAGFAADVTAFLTGLDEAETPQRTRARTQAYAAAKLVEIEGGNKSEAGRAYIRVMRAQGEEPGPTEVMRVAGMTSRSLAYRLINEPAADTQRDSD